MGACGSTPARNHFKGNGNSLQQAQQSPAATTAGTPGPVTPASPMQSPGYRLGGSLGSEKIASSPPGNGGAPQPQNTTDQIEREKRLQAIAMRENKLKGKTVTPRVFQPEQ